MLDLVVAALSLEAVGASFTTSFFSNCDSEHQPRLVAKSSLENLDRPELWPPPIPESDLMERALKMVRGYKIFQTINCHIVFSHNLIADLAEERLVRDPRW